MKKQYFLIFLLSSTIISTAFGAQAPQVGYWQRFKNWMSGGASQAQEMANIPYEWAKEFIAGLTKQQKDALVIALGLSMVSLNAQKEYTPEGVGLALTGGAIAGTTALLVRPYIDNILKELRGLSKKEKIAELQQMHKDHSLSGKTPDEFMLNAVDEAFIEVSKEK